MATREPHHERLSALDASFLGLEDAASHMHIGSVGVYEMGDAAAPSGGLDIDRIRHVVDVALADVPRCRQRIERVPYFDHPVWVDDPHFNLAYHTKHTRLPLPGDDRLLKRLAGRLMSQQLDRRKPLWETWYVEGLEGNRFAVVSKVHHCMVDGIGGVEVTTAALRHEPGHDPREDAPPSGFDPRPVPTGSQLLLSEVAHRAGHAAAFVGNAASELWRSPRTAFETVRGTIDGIVEGVAKGRSSTTPFNAGDIGPHRRFDWTAMDLATMKALKNKLGGTLNDAVLTIVAGAMRRFLASRGVDVDHLEFRAMVPVNLRGGEGGVGNRVASMVARLPVDEPDVLRRFERMHAEQEAVKHSHQIDAAMAVESLSDWTFTNLIPSMSRLAIAAQPFNLVVTNVPGPQFPLYLLGARLLECYPLVPIFHNQAVGVALFSYDGRLYWGFNADWDVVPGLHDLVLAIDAEFQHLLAATGVEELQRPAGRAAVA